MAGAAAGAEGAPGGPSRGHAGREGAGECSKLQNSGRLSVCAPPAAPVARQPPGRRMPGLSHCPSATAGAAARRLPAPPSAQTRGTSSFALPPHLALLHRASPASPHQARSLRPRLRPRPRPPLSTVVPPWVSPCPSCCPASSARRRCVSRCPLAARCAASAGTPVGVPRLRVPALTPTSLGELPAAVSRLDPPLV